MKTILLFAITYACLAMVFLFSGGDEKSVNKSAPDLKPAYHTDKQFNGYWYGNKAELTRFTLKQARYGEIHRGDAVLIFVSEHLSPKTLLKTSNETGEDIPALKLNINRRFFTGLYPYSLLTSVFTPVNLDENKHTMRVTFSSQEWCGHTFSFIDLKSDAYVGMSHSYFPDEGDEKIRIKIVPLEDEIWNRIRIDYENLPTGNIELLPSFTYLRLRHLELKPYLAYATLEDVTLSEESEEELMQYRLIYDGLDREFSIIFEKAFPYKIKKWKETSLSGFGRSVTRLTTEAEATNTLMLDYWDKHSLSDSTYRDQFNIH